MTSSLLYIALQGSGFRVLLECFDYPTKLNIFGYLYSNNSDIVASSYQIIIMMHYLCKPLLDILSISNIIKVEDKNI